MAEDEGVEPLAFDYLGFQDLLLTTERHLPLFLAVSAGIEPALLSEDTLAKCLGSQLHYLP